MPKCKRFQWAIFALSLLLVVPSGAWAASGSKLAATPPMGWNSWNYFHGNVTEADVKAAADELVKSGLAADGYIYVNVDDTWQGKRDAEGNIHPNSKFPDMKGLAEYIHARGLKFGIYSSPGPKTCAGYEGSYGHVAQDARTYASWGVDYLKYDLCSFRKIMKEQSDGNPQKAFDLEKAAYLQMHEALVATGRPIVYSLCQYGWNDVWKWGPEVGGNLWRTTGDINDTWARMSQIGFMQAGLAKYAGPGHWNDPDMLEIGNGGMDYNEEVTHMTLWSILAAPLILGNDLSKMTPQTLSIVGNREVIAVDQDKLGREGNRVWEEGPESIWAKPLSGGAKAVAIFNRASTPRTVSLRLSMVGFGPHAHLRDLWAHKAVTATNGVYTVTIPRHGAVMLKLTR